MIVLRALPAAAIALVLAALGYGASSLMVAQGRGLPWISDVYTAIFLALLCIGLVIAGAWVYRTRTRKSRRAVGPHVAVRILALGQGAGILGAIWLGWHAGVLIYLATVGAFGSAAAWDAVASALGGALTLATGFVVQALCRIPPEDMEGEDEGRGIAGAG